MKEVLLKEILIFAGTTEGRKLSEYLARAGVSHTICVATEYGEIVLTPHPMVKVHRGRMDQDQIAAFLKNKGFAAVVDATHPFATGVTHNIRAALEQIRILGTGIPYLRLKRDCTTQTGRHIEQAFQYFETNAACAEALEHTEGNILLTTGSKELSTYCASETMKSRLYVRVLPSVESISTCMEQGVCGKQIIAMQGPFTTEMNEAVIRQYQISHLVTKESGISGGYQEKLEAAGRTGTQVFVIGCPDENEGYSFREICSELENICGKKFQMNDVTEKHLEIILAGIGMGHENGLTREVYEAVSEADILLGAERMLANLHTKKQLKENIEKHPFYQAEQIIPYLQTLQADKRIVVLFSGDSGFYSGCQSLSTALEKEIQEKRLQASIRIMPGISSVAHLSACIGESYHDAAVYSIHGKKICNLVRRIKNSPKTFLLTSGVRDVNRLGQLLAEADMAECEIITGFQLSYEGQQIRKLTPLECCGLNEEGLYTCLIKNPCAANKRLTHGTADDTFVRDKVPMTKEEVREVSICKLRLHDRAVVYDIGSGTGSVAVEIASLSDDIQVYAVERKKEAVSLIEKNKEKFDLQNITVVEAEAPEGLRALPAATHAFIGGSGGRLKEILAALRQISPKMRIVINAVSMETICEIREMLSLYKITGEAVQLQVSRAKKMGHYHLMQSENPVWIFAFDLEGDNMRGDRNEN